MKRKFFQRRKPEPQPQPLAQPITTADDLERLGALAAHAGELLQKLLAEQGRYTDALADAFPPLAAAFEGWAVVAEQFVALAKRFNMREGHEVAELIAAGRVGMGVLQSMGVREESKIKWPQFLPESVTEQSQQ